MHVARIIATGLLLAGAADVAAQPGMLAGDGDAQQGRVLVERDCNACHVRLVGDAGRIYTRDDRRVRTPAQLRAQIAYCNTQLGTGYFPEDEEHVAAWLEQRYYRFKP
jgi:cytochrome c5